MDSQASPHASISISRQTMSQQISGSRQAAPVPTGYHHPPAATPYLPVDIMMYHSATPLVIPNPSAVSQCVITPPFLCQTCMMYSTTNNPCSVHHTPIAYGQAGSSFVAANSIQPSTQQVVSNSQSSVDPRTTIQHTTGTVQPNNQQRRDPIEMARHNAVPTLTGPARSMTMRMKRGQPISTRVQQSLDALSAQRPTKLRRVASDGPREIQAIRAEVQQQENSPSTSQLVTGPVPSTHACPGCAPGQRCPSCAQCYCSHCPLSAGGTPHAHVNLSATSSSLLLAAQAAPFVSQLTQHQLQQQQQVQQMRYVQDSMMASQMQQFYVQQHQQAPHHHHHPSHPAHQTAHTTTHSAAHAAAHQVAPQGAQNAVAVPAPSQAAAHAAAALQAAHHAAAAASVAANSVQPMLDRHQQQLQHQQIFSRLLPRTGHSLFLLPGRTGPITPASFELNTMLVNVVPSELIMDRPMLERHHMFTAPNSEPQPVGLNSQEIEKYTEKMQFIKDVDVPEEEQERCTVCQCEFETGEEIRNLACTHQFHVGCIDRWLGYNKKCPICRLDIDHQKVVLVE